MELPKIVNDALNKIHKKGFPAYIVGGAVRDLLLGKKTDNWDFATSATPEEIQQIFPDSFYNNKFGTVTVPSIDKIFFEITTFRSESEYKDQRHPEKVTWAKTIEEDLSRRDFTVNAIAYDGKNIIDPFDGQKDIKNKVIRAVGNPDKRFSEDALRLARAIRFASELGFLIEEQTRLSIQKNAQLITKISGERIRDELFKILASTNPAEGILFMRNTGLLTFILPEVDLCFIIPQKSPNRHHIYDVGTHSIMSLKHCPSKDIITRFASLLHDIGKAKTFAKDEKTGQITFYNHEMESTKQARIIAERLKLSNREKDKLLTLIRYHQFTLIEIQTDKAVRRFIRQVGKEYIQDMLNLRTADRIGSGSKPTSWRLELFKNRLKQVQKEPFKITDLKINGNDVMKELKIKPGPQVGQVLKKLFDEVVDGKIKNEKKSLLTSLKQSK